MWLGRSYGLLVWMLAKCLWIKCGVYPCRHNDRQRACVRVRVGVCVCVIYISIKRPNHPNVKQNIIELMKVKVLARVKYSAYLCK